jgi:hypothetical protein
MPSFGKETSYEKDRSCYANRNRERIKRKGWWKAIIAGVKRQTCIECQKGGEMYMSGQNHVSC